MKKLILASMIYILFLQSFVNAGEWTPDKSKKYSLKIDTYSKYVLSAANKNWINSLIQYLNKNGNVKSFYTCIRTNLSLSINKKPTDIIVYKILENENQFLIYSDDECFLVDTKRKEITIPCGSSLSFHPNEEKDFIVIVDPVGSAIGGIPVMNTNHNVLFKDNRITWH